MRAAVRLALALALALPPLAPAADPPPAAAAEAVLATTLPGLDRQPVSLARFRGRPLVVNFWATWCAPCREEIPHLVRLHERYRERGVAFVGIAVDNSDQLVNFSKLKGITYPVAVGFDQGVELMRALGNGKAALPFTVVLDGQGRIVLIKRGPVAPGELEALLERLSG